MPAYGRTSSNNLRTAHPLLRLLFNRVVEDFDNSITCGHRGKIAQNKAFADGDSEKQWPDGEHNEYPSRAVDSHPYPHPGWEDRDAFILYAGRVMGVAAMLGIKLRWGGDWDSDDDLHDQKLYDLVHFELVDA